MSDSQISKYRRALPGAALAFAAFTALSAVGCGDDDDSMEGTGGSAATGGSAETGGMAATGGSASTGGSSETGGMAATGGTQATQSRFVLASQVLTLDTPITNVLLASDITDPPGFADAVEQIPGRGLVFAGPEEDVFFTGGNTSATITKYEATGEDSVAKVGELSMGEEGVTGIGEYQTNMHFVSAEKAYYFDGGTAKVIVWNPKDMLIVDTINLGGLAQDGTVLSFSSVPAVQVGSLVVMPAAYRAADGLSLPSLTAAVIVDTDNDSAKVITDDRCGYVRDAVLGDDDLVYLATEVWGSAVHRVSPGSAPEPCLLRIDPEEEAYDPDFHVELTDVADGATVGSLMKLPDGTIITRVLDEDLATIDGTTNPRALAGLPVWGFATVTLGDEPTVTVIEGAEPILGSLLPFVAGDKVYQPHFEMRTETVLWPVSAEGTGTASETIEGLVFSAAQVR